MGVVPDLVQRNQLIGKTVSAGSSTTAAVSGRLLDRFLVLEADGVVQVGRPLRCRQLLMVMGRCQRVQVRRHNVDRRERRVGSGFGNTRRVVRSARHDHVRCR